MRFTASFDKLNNRRVFACTDCYDKKDILKSNGFRWNSNAKSWEKVYNNPAELSRILMETMMLCECPYEVYEEMYSRPSNYDELASLEDLSVWDREYFADFCEKYDLEYGEEQVSCDENAPTEDQEFETTISERDAMELVIATGLRQTPEHGWFIKPETDGELIQLLNEHKATLMRYMHGECFRRQAQLLRRVDGVEWVLMKCPAVLDAPKATEIFSGTAFEVDRWCEEHADDPLFTDEYVCKYDVAWRTKEAD